MSIDRLAPNLADERADPEGTAIEAVQHSAIRRWLRDDVPPDVAGCLVDWLDQERQREALLVRLARRVRPFVPALVSRLEGEPVAAIS